MPARARPFFYELFRIYKIHRLLLILGGVILIAAGLIPLLEASHPDTQIRSFGAGLWWVIATVTSTGYGDLVPVSVSGRVLGGVLMFSGIALFSTTAALVASYFAYRRTKRTNLRMFRQLEDQDDRLSSIEKKLDYLVKKGQDSRR